MKSTRLNLEALGDRIVPSAVASPDFVYPLPPSGPTDYGYGSGSGYPSADLTGTNSSVATLPTGYGSGSGYESGSGYGSGSSYGSGFGSGSSSGSASGSGYGSGGTVPSGSDGSWTPSGGYYYPGSPSGSGSGSGSGGVSDPATPTTPGASYLGSGWSAITGILTGSGTGGGGVVGPSQTSPYGPPATSSHHVSNYDPSVTSPQYVVSYDPPDTSPQHVAIDNPDGSSVLMTQGNVPTQGSKYSMGWGIYGAKSDPLVPDGKYICESLGDGLPGGPAVDAILPYTPIYTPPQYITPNLAPQPGVRDMLYRPDHDNSTIGDMLYRRDNILDDAPIELWGGPLFGYEYPWSENASWNLRGSMVGDAGAYVAGTVIYGVKGAADGVTESVILVPPPFELHTGFEQRYALGRIGGNVLGMGLGFGMMITGAAAAGAGGTAEVVSLGIATPVAVPVAVVGGITVVAGGVVVVGGGYHFIDNVHNFPEGGGGGGAVGTTTSPVTTPKNAVRDFPTPNTKNWSATYKSEGEARNLARQKLGENPIEVEPGKWRSADGKWQYRAKPGDVADRHVHLEELVPETGEVIQNLHLRWPEGAGR